MPRSGRTVATVVAVTTSLCFVTACGQSADGSQTVRALWYGKQVDGSIAQGVTPVTVNASVRAAESRIAIDLSGMERADTGDYWNAAARSAAAVGTINSAVDPRNVSISFDVDESIDGPSAGGLLTVAVSSDLANEQVEANKSMTGTILPDGSLGPVGGIPAKIRAAASAGITTVVIPKGQRNSVDPESRRTVDVIEQGHDLGVQVIEAIDVNQAYEAIVGDVAVAVVAEPGAVDPDLQKTLATESRRTLRQLESTPVKTGGTDAATDRVRDSIQDAMEYVRTALDRGDSIKAYATASEAMGVVYSWNAAVVARQRATLDLDEVSTGLADMANRAQAEIQARLDDASARTPTAIEQVPALVDALCWGVDALNEIQQAQREIADAATPGDVARAASTIAGALYDGTDRLSTAVDGALVTGRTALSDASSAWSFVDGYAELLAEAAAANVAYAAEAGKSKGASARDQELSRIALDRWNAVDGRELPANSAALRTASALSAFVSSSLLVTGIGAVTDARSADVPVSKLTIALREAFDQQVEVATSLGAYQAKVLAGAQLDPSYSVWGNEWGGFLASQPPTTLIADEVRRDGLTYQLYSNVQAKMLTALARSV